MKQKHARKGAKNLLALGCLFMLLFSGAGLHAQSRQVTGIVTDSSGPLAGVSVIVKGAQAGVVTDAQGRYAIRAEEDQTLVFKFTGYGDQEVRVGNRTVIDVVMADEVTELEDVVVIGYGTVKRRDLTGSVSSIKEDVILATPTGNVMQSLQGRVAGLDFTRVDGEDKMVLRGHRSIGGTNDPLIIIDGVQGGQYTDVSPADIASIDVLKDASSTAIYGSWGANGVIIITTKAPEKGKLSVSYNAYAGWNMWADENTRRVGESWLSPRRIAAQNSGKWASEADDIHLFGDMGDLAYEAYLRGEWTDYRELISRKPFFTNHTISFAGGTEKTSARFTVGWEEQQTKRRGGLSDHFNLRTIVDHKLNDWLSTGVNIRLAHDYRTTSPYESDGGWQLGKPYDENGELVEYPLAKPGTDSKAGYVNPLLDKLSNVNVEKSHNTRISATGYIDIKPISGLTIRSQMNTNFSFSVKGSYEDTNSTNKVKDQLASESEYEMIPKRYLEWNNIATYEKMIGDHSFGVTAITAWTKNMEENLKGNGNGQNLPQNLWYAMGGTLNQRIYSDYKQKQTFSYAARVNYSYKGKYLLTGSWRRDGASMLSPGHKWTDFPSAAFAWRVSDESFMEGTSGWLDNLKLRLSYGVTGNAWIPEYATQSGVVASTTGLGIQDVGLLHYDYANKIGNKDTKWETSENINLGIDFTIWGGRLDGTIELYNTNTRDLLLERKLPSSAGADGMFTIMQNIGRTNNKGIELTLSGFPIRTRNFTWRSTLTFSRNVEKIKELIDGQNITMGSGGTDKEKRTLMIGRPIESFNTYTYQGIWTSAEKEKAATYFTDDNKVEPFVPGDYKILDHNGDNIINMNDDYGFLGSTTPDWFAGFDHNFRYKNFDLNIYFFFRWGQWGDNPGANMDPGTGGGYTLYDKWFYAAGKNESGAKLPPLNASKQAYTYYGYQSVWFCDRSFFKVKNVSLGYTFPQSVLSNAGIRNLRLYVSAANPLYFSKSDWLKGRDPEGVLRNYVLGVEFSF